ncbi:MAG: ATP-binding protein [Pseudomonadota bacterium]
MNDLLDILSLHLKNISRQLTHIADEIDDTSPSQPLSISYENKHKLKLLFQSTKNTLIYLANHVTNENVSIEIKIIKNALDRNEKQISELLSFQINDSINDTKIMPIRKKFIEIASDLSTVFKNNNVHFPTSFGYYNLTGNIRNSDSFFTIFLSNLIANAVIHGQSHRPFKLTLQSEKCGLNNDGNELINVIVEDNGPGISSADQERVFKLFERGVVVNGKPGSGVGLAFAKEACRIMGGSLHLDKNFKGGARFVASLPDIRN